MNSRQIASVRWVLALLLVVFATSPLLAATRTFVPVQAGPLAQAEEVELFAPDRVLVKFTSDAINRGALDIALDKGTAVRGAVTGLPSIDAILADAGVKSIERPYHELRDADKGRELGVDRWFMVHTARGDMERLAKDLEADRAVEAVSLDWVAFPAATPADPLYADHWGHNNTA